MGITSMVDVEDDHQELVVVDAVAHPVFAAPGAPTAPRRARSGTPTTRGLLDNGPEMNSQAAKAAACSASAGK
jgi:hypothetical protein